MKSRMFIERWDSPGTCLIKYSAIKRLLMVNSSPVVRERKEEGKKKEVKQQ